MAGPVNVPPAGGCMITPTPDDPCPFHGKAGSVTLGLNDMVGTVDFVRANYDSQPIPVTPKNITFTLAAGQKDLEIVYLFSDTVNGKGELREVCPANTLLAVPLAGDDVQILTICV